MKNWIRALSNASVALLVQIQHFLLFILDSLSLLIPRRSASGIKKKVLIIRLDGIGDFILWLDSAKELRSIYPRDGYELYLLANRLFSDMARELPHFDHVWDVDLLKLSRNPAYRIKLIAQIRREGFSTVVHPIYSRIFEHGDSLVRISGADERIGSQGDISNIKTWLKWLTDRWYSRLVPATSQPLMELARNAEFIRGIGAPYFQSCIAEIPVEPRMPKGFDLTDYYVVIPGAGNPVRQWPIARFAEIADRIYRTTGWTGVVCGGHREKNLFPGLEQQASAPLQNWIGKTALVELVSIIRKARILIGNDTGAIHIAAAVSTPSVAVFGGGHFGRFLPYQIECHTERPSPMAVYHSMDCFNCNWGCKYIKDEDDAGRCIEMVSTDQVWKAVQTILSRTVSRKEAEMD